MIFSCVLSVSVPSLSGQFSCLLFCSSSVISMIFFIVFKTGELGKQTGSSVSVGEFVNWQALFQDMCTGSSPYMLEIQNCPGFAHN